AIREHQLSPPRFMSRVYSQMLHPTPGNAEEAEAAKTISMAFAHPMQQQPMYFAPHTGYSKVEITVSLNDVEGVAGKPVLLPESVPHKVVAFTQLQQAMLLQDTGVPDIYLPNDQSPHSRSSVMVRVGDGNINYRRRDGVKKIVEIRGPETQPFLRDKTVFES